MTDEERSDEILALLRAVRSKRPKVVIEHILQHGYITTEELKTEYGYNHPPRAARDVREQGIPLETFHVVDTTGRTIAAYRFGDLSQIETGRLGGRKAFSKLFKDLLVHNHGAICSVCHTPYESRYLQIDHRVPYQVIGDSDIAAREPSAFMLLCGSCNRAKSWSREHCVNWNEMKSPAICLTCYWANPLSYTHVALRDIRRADIVWTEDEIAIFEKLKVRAEAQGKPVPEFVKAIVANYLRET
jgi:hypothetical protein